VRNGKKNLILKTLESHQQQQETELRNLRIKVLKTLHKLKLKGSTVCAASGDAVFRAREEILNRRWLGTGRARAERR